MNGKTNSIISNVGRNDPCPCGSGLKYKKCCLGKAGQPKPQPQQADLQPPQKELEALSDQYFTTREYIQEVGYPVQRFDLLVLEVMNVIGTVLHNFGNVKQEKVTEIFRKIVSNTRGFYTLCLRCENECLKQLPKEESLQPFVEKGLRLELLPEALQKPVSANYFYHEFIDVCISAVIQELQDIAPENDLHAIIPSIYYAVLNFIADNCWKRCNNECLKNHGKNAYCSFCTFGAQLPCPRDGGISYEEICATEQDMEHWRCPRKTDC